MVEAVGRGDESKQIRDFLIALSLSSPMDFCQKEIEYGEVSLNSELLPATFWGF